MPQRPSWPCPSDVVAEQLRGSRRARRFCLAFELLDDEIDLELREPVQLQLEDRVGLLLVELEAAS